MIPYLYLLFFCSGAAGLIYELHWLHSFSLFFGNTTQASAAVFASFFAGLAFGNRWLGPRSDRVRNPLRFYALLEILIPIAVLASEAVMLLYPSLLAGMAESVVPSHGVGMILKLVFTFLVLSIPTFLMGGTLPAMIRAVVFSESDWLRRTPTLYGIHTVGAVAGTLLGGWILPPWLGTHALLPCALFLNVAAAAGSFILSRRASVFAVKCAGRS